jgi:hypothetical protein
MAASEANVTIVWTDGITGPRCRHGEILSNKFCSIKLGVGPALILALTVAALLQPK